MNFFSSYRPAALALTILLAVAPTHGDEPAQNPSAVQALAEIGEPIQLAIQAMRAGKFDEAGKALESVIHSEVFPRIDPGLQYHTFLLASLAADGRQDHLGAHEFAMAATHFPMAKAEQWLQRARFAARVDNFVDAALSMTTVAQRWPAELQKTDHNEFAFQLGLQLTREPRAKTEHLAMLNALFDAGFTIDLGEQPSFLWQQLVLDAVTRNDLARARELIARVDDTEELLRMRVDKRFDALRKLEPGRFDLAAAMKRRTAAWKTVVADHPRRLHAVVMLAGALSDQGRFADTLELCDAALKKLGNTPGRSVAYDDLDKALNWLHNAKASALRGMGRFDEAMSVMDAGRIELERGFQNVSQAINLGGYYLDAGRPEKALASIDGIDWAKSLSPYGRMQLQRVRYEAYLQMGDEAAADDVFAYLRQHHADAEQTWLWAMLSSGDMDGAAALLISQLEDADKRATALAQVQQYPETPAQPRAQQRRERWKSLLARPDVTAAINAVGRRESVPLFN